MVLTVLVVVAATAGLTWAMLHVPRRLSPQVVHHDTNVAAGVFSVVGTAFAVLLAFVFFSVFGSYSAARTTVGVEALSVQQMFATAGFFAPASRDELRGELVCYGRAVVEQEWLAMAQERGSPSVDGWVLRLQATSEQLDVSTPLQSSAFSAWLDERDRRQEGRRGRLTEAVPFVPPFVWVTLVLSAALVLALGATLPSPHERRGARVALMAALAGTVVLSLSLIWVLDRPFDASGVEIQPERLAAAVSSMEAELQRTTPGAALPCDDAGRPTSE